MIYQSKIKIIAIFKKLNNVLNAEYLAILLKCVLRKQNKIVFFAYKSIKILNNNFKSLN